MNEIIERARKGQASAAELAELASWRNASPDNEREYLALSRLLEAAAELGSMPAAAPAPSAAELLRRAARSPYVMPQPRRRPWLPWGVAAAAMLALALVSGRQLLRAPAPAWGGAEITTGAAELATLHLTDGSVVRLGPDTRLQVVPGAGARDVVLEGQAYFTIAKAQTPFRVRTPYGQVRVLGTRFELNTRDERLSLVVVEGRVALSARGRDVEVNGGERSGVLQGALLPPVKLANADSALLWIGKFLVFQSTPLTRAVAEVERMYGLRIEVTDPDIAQRTVTATFTNRSAAHVMGVLCTVVNAQCSGRNGDYVIAR